MSLALLASGTAGFVNPSRSWAESGSGFSGVNSLWWDENSYSVDAEYTAPYWCTNGCNFSLTLVGETMQYIGYYVGWDWAGTNLVSLESRMLGAEERIHIQTAGTWTSASPVRGMAVMPTLNGNSMNMGGSLPYVQQFAVGNLSDREILNALSPALLADVDPCHVLLFRPGTHNANSSVTDQYLACETQHKAARESVQSAAELLAPRKLFDYVLAMRRALGHAFWLDWLQTLLRTPAEDLFPQPGDPEQPPSPSEDPTNPPVESDAGVLDDLVATLPERRQGPVKVEISDAQRRAALQECLRLTRILVADSANPCKSLPVLFVGKDAQSAAVHDRDVMISRPDLVQLHYRPANKSPVPERWKNAQPACISNNGQAAKTGLACDEYPFRASAEHDFDVSLRLVDFEENRREGVVFIAMLNGCGLRTSSQQEPFLVVPLVSDDAPPSHYICGLKSGGGGVDTGPLAPDVGIS
jgi:hypothetical protein